MTNVHGEKFELSVNQKRLWFLNKHNLDQLYTQLSVGVLNEVDTEKLIAILNRVTDNHETLSSALIIDKNSIFPFQTPHHFKTTFIKIFPITAYDSWVFNKEDKIKDDKLENFLPIQFFIFSDKEQIVKKLIFRVNSFWTDLFGGFRILDNISSVLAGLDIKPEAQEKVIIHRNFAAWQNELVNEKNNEGVNFWSNYSYDLSKKTIPFGGKRLSDFQPKKIVLYEIAGDQYLKMAESFNKKQIAPEFHFLASVIHFMRNYDKSNITLGYTLFGRVYEVLNKTVGLISKTVPLKIDEFFDINNKESVENLLDNIEKIKDWSDYYGINYFDDNPEKIKFKVCFQYIDVNFPSQSLETPNYIIEDVCNMDEAFEIKFTIINFGDRLKIEFYHDINIFNDSEISIISDHFMNSLREVISEIYFPIKNSNIIPSVLNKLNCINVNKSDLDNSILDLIEKQVHLYPESIAIRSESHQITYLQLWEKTNSFANNITEKYGSTQGKAIAVLLLDPLDYIISVLAILKTGAFFVPLDSSNADQRINFVLKDCNCSIFITEKVIESKIVFSGDILFYENLEKLTFNPVLNLKLLSGTAYVIYTSGSSGFPKGVMVSHRSLTNYISWAKNFYLELSDLGNSGLFTSFSFDLTLTSIFVPLINGKTVFTQHSNLSVDEKLIRIIENPEIDLIKLTPSHISLLSVLNFKARGRKIIICGGESLSKHHIQQLHKLIPDVRIYNEYGPTEATVGCIVKQINSEDEQISIGYPISNTKIKIVSENGECSIGSIGEILIGGECLALGYLNNAEETQKSFFFYGENLSEIFYKSGDLGRVLSTGEIEYIGRKDDQIKIKGYRVELGEIEYHLKNFKDISDAAVIYVKNEFNEGELVAFIVSVNNLLLTDLKEHLKSLLPDYMIPQNFMLIEKIPLTSNGKIDRNFLINHQSLAKIIKVEYVAARNEIETKITEMLSELLKKPKDSIGVYNNFYDLGVDSIKLIRLLTLINKEFNLNLKVVLLFEYSNIDSLAKYISKPEKNTDEIEVMKQDDISDAMDEMIDLM